MDKDKIERHEHTTSTFIFVIQLLFPAQHYKSGDNNTNELLIINLTSVRAGRMLVRNTTEHDKRTETGDLF
jgi:hypothetical protein